MTLDRFCHERIFRPLGLRTTGFVDLSLLRTRRLEPVTEMIAPTERCPWRKKILCGEVHDDNAYAMGGVAGHAGLFCVGEGPRHLLVPLEGLLSRRQPDDSAAHRARVLDARRDACPARPGPRLGHAVAGRLERRHALLAALRRPPRLHRHLGVARSRARPPRHPAHQPRPSRAATTSDQGVPAAHPRCDRRALRSESDDGADVHSRTPCPDAVRDACARAAHPSDRHLRRRHVGARRHAQAARLRRVGLRRERLPADEHAARAPRHRRSGRASAPRISPIAPISSSSATRCRAPTRRSRRCWRAACRTCRCRRRWRSCSSRIAAPSWSPARTARRRRRRCSRGCSKRAGRDPSVMVGGDALDFGGNYKLGSGERFVIEGDEYDTAFFDKGPKFLHYRPQALLLTAVEFDHADIYRDLDHVKDAFRQLVAILPARRAARRGHRLPARARRRQEAHSRLITFGLGRRVAGRRTCATTARTRSSTSRTTARPSAARASSSRAASTRATRSACSSWRARSACDRRRSCRACASFRGVARRQEVVGEWRGITVIDDFAHHPTAVAGAIAALRLRYPRRRLWAVFEPRSNTSRRKVFQREYVRGLRRRRSGDHRRRVPQGDRPGRASRSCSRPSSWSTTWSRGASAPARSPTPTPSRPRCSTKRAAATSSC